VTTGWVVVVVTTGTGSVVVGREVVVLVVVVFVLPPGALVVVVVVVRGARVGVAVARAFGFAAGDVVRSVFAFFGRAAAAVVVVVDAAGSEVTAADGSVGDGAGVADSSACEAAAKPMTTVAARPATASPEVTAAAVRCARWR
jgi:hypothetical protein